MAALLMTASACAGTPASQTPSTSASQSAVASSSQPAPSGQPFRIGVFLTLSGPAAALGQHELEGARVALDEINAKGGVNGRKLEISQALDTAADANKAVSIYNQLQGDASNIVLFGPTFGTETLPISPIMARDKMPMVIPQTLGDGLPGTQYAFLAAYTNKTEAEAARDWLLAKGLTKAAILHTTDQYGTDGATYLAQMQGITITANEPMEPGALDANTQLTKIRSSNPQAILLWGTAPNTGIALKNMGELGIDLPILSGIAAHSVANIDVAANSPALKNWNLQAVADPNNPLPRQKAGIESLQKATGAAPDVFHSIGYDCIYIIAEGLKNAGSNPDRASLRDALANIEGLDGIDGVYTFKGKTNGAGLDKTAILILNVKDGKFAPGS
jgi:branched-chain amino acid transport system substrate-binding protein